MSITIDFSPAEMEVITAQAKAGNTSVEEFIRTSSAKAARNAEYLAMLDRAVQSMNEGRGTFLTDEQLRGLVYGNNI